MMMMNVESSHFDRKFVLVWLGLVLWHIINCRLFNVKSISIHINSSLSKNSV